MSYLKRNTFAVYASLFATLDVLWGIIVATLVSILVSQGLSVAGLGTIAATTGGVGIWIVGFIFALIEGAVFLAVYGAFTFLIISIVADATNSDRKARRNVIAYTSLAVVVDVIWAAIIGTFASSVLTYFGLYIGAAANATTLGATLLWIVAFVCAFAVGAGFLAVTSALGFLIYAVCKK